MTLTVARPAPCARLTSSETVRDRTCVPFLSFLRGSERERDTIGIGTIGHESRPCPASRVPSALVMNGERGVRVYRAAAQPSRGLLTEGKGAGAMAAEKGFRCARLRALQGRLLRTPRKRPRGTRRCVGGGRPSAPPRPAPRGRILRSQPHALTRFESRTTRTGFCFLERLAFRTHSIRVWSQHGAMTPRSPLRVYRVGCASYFESRIVNLQCMRNMRLVL